MVENSAAASTATMRTTMRRSHAERDGCPQQRSLAPDVGGHLDDQPELGHLLLVAEVVALGRRGEAALRGQAELLERHVLARLVDAALERVRTLQLPALRRDQPEHDLLARWDEAERFEAAGALVVVLEEEAVDIQLGEQRLRDEVVPALG